MTNQNKDKKPSKFKILTKEQIQKLLEEINKEKKQKKRTRQTPSFMFISNYIDAVSELKCLCVFCFYDNHIIFDDDGTVIYADTCIHNNYQLGVHDESRKV